jgi:TRAP transporter TAXI family solute receptor
MKRLGLIFAAILLVVSGMIGLVTYIYSLPTTLKIAVSQNTDLRLVNATAQLFARGRESIRLKVIPVDGTTASAAKIEKGEVDLAIVRSDVAMPTNTQTIAIMHRNAGILIAPSSSSLRSISDLKGRTIGMVRGSASNSRMLDTILAQYEVLPNSVRRLNLNPGDVAGGLRSGRIDLVFAVGSPLGPLVNEMVSVATEVGGGAPIFLSVDEAEAIAKRLPSYDAIGVLRGLFGGTPPKPAEKFVTLGMTYRLVASDKLSDALAGELARLIFTLKPALVQDVPSATLIEPPSTEKGEGPPVHPGAAEYFDGTQQTFFDRYGDYFYLFLIGFSMVGSAMAAFIGRAMSRDQQRDRARVDALTQRLVIIMRSVRTAEDDARLDDFQHEIDEIFAIAVHAASSGVMQDGQLAALSLAMDQVRRALSERRANLQKLASPYNGPAQQPTYEPLPQSLRPVA